ncbi:L,D-transpeptidase [Mesorhizobium sp. SP-1A]|uniref:L,D-transpeptidase family protein n=1 Tax=Mesorhizobium sp. SP-1A TaxID=3077840 RepID=UPI0028F73FDD|nr:L,D-transpeptidase [Mesorhizobium sp. SP-1A]
MLRKICLFSAFAATFVSTAAMAAQHPTSADRIAEGPARADSVGIQVAQAGDYEIYYDGRGNRVIVDSYTGKVVAIQPPQGRFDRRALRLQERQRQFDGDGGYYSDGQGDTTRYRRLRRNGDQYLGPADGPDDYGDSQDAFPPAPGSGDAYAYPDEQAPSEIRREPIQQQPMKEASVGPSSPQEPTTVTPAPNLDGKATVNSSLALGGREDIAALQVLLDRSGASPGVIDGRFGSNVDKALAAYREITGVNLQSTDAAAIKEELQKTGGDAFASYTITPEDAAGPYVASVPEDYSQKAKLERMSYTSVTEALAERFHMDEAYLKALNPGLDFNRPGTVIRVANFGKLVSTPVARIIADKAQKQVRAYSADGKLVAAYPATIGSTDTPSPSGIHTVSRIAFNPNYTYNPNLNFKQGDNDKILTIPPGPNGPVGSIWIALDKPTYGIHGTPDPSKIGKTASHGCVRLTNWDATELAKLVKPGVTVEFTD